MEPKVSLIISGNLYMRQMRFDKGDIELGHCHTYDHLTLLSTGSLRITVDGSTTDFVAPSAIKILANKIHELEALENGTLAYCVHALRDASTEDVLPASAELTDRETKSFCRTDAAVLVKPNHKAVVVNGQEVDVAPIALIKTADLQTTKFNRNQDDTPLLVRLPSGELEGGHFV